VAEDWLAPPLKNYLAIDGVRKIQGQRVFGPDSTSEHGPEENQGVHGFHSKRSSTVAFSEANCLQNLGN
jgi:hypothetical protein